MSFGGGGGGDVVGDQQRQRGIFLKLPRPEPCGVIESGQKKVPLRMSRADDHLYKAYIAFSFIVPGY